MSNSVMPAPSSLARRSVHAAIITNELGREGVRRVCAAVAAAGGRADGLKKDTSVADALFGQRRGQAVATG
jgi:hypothetical protein